MIPNGKHRGRALRGELGYTNNGNEQVGIEFEFLDLPGERRTYYGTFTENGTPHTLKAMRAAGFRGNDITDMSWFERNDTPEVVLVVEHETYEGRTRDKIKFVNSTGGIGMKSKMDPDRAREFAARMRGELITTNDEGLGRESPSSPQQARSTRLTQTSRQPQNVEAPDDIPF